jgi:hypothetical protein
LVVAGKEDPDHRVGRRRDRAHRRPPSFIAPFVWAAVVSVGTILAVVAAIWLMLE